MKIEERAYIAGILDGEGCFQIKPYSSYRHSFDPLVVVWNTSRIIIDYLQNVCGGRIHPQLPRKKSHRMGWRWVISSGEIRRILPELIPFLRAKREQAELVLELAQLNAKRNSGRMYRKPLTEDEQRQRYALYEKLKCSR